MYAIRSYYGFQCLSIAFLLRQGVCKVDDKPWLVRVKPHCATEAQFGYAERFFAQAVDSDPVVVVSKIGTRSQKLLPGSVLGRAPTFRSSSASVHSSYNFV